MWVEKLPKDECPRASKDKEVVYLRSGGSREEMVT
jgi:hypothetical protein